MTYTHESLLEDEKIVCLLRMHRVIFLWPILLVLIAFVFYFNAFELDTHIVLLNMSLPLLFGNVLLILAAYQLVTYCIMYKCSEYAITDRRVIMKSGFIVRHTAEMFLDKIEAVVVNQSIMGRLYQYGAVRLVGTGGTQDEFLFVPEPLRFRRILQQQADLYKRGG